MGAAASVVEETGLETTIEAYGQVSDVSEYTFANDRKRSAIGIATGFAVGELTEAVILGSTIAGPVGAITTACVAYAAAQTAKTIYDSS